MYSSSVWNFCRTYITVCVNECTHAFVLPPDGAGTAAPHLHAVPRHALDELVFVVGVWMVLLLAAHARVHLLGVHCDVTVVVAVVLI